MSSMIDFTRFFEQMVGRSYGFDDVISEIAACTDGIMGAPPDALALRRLCDRAVFRLYDLDPRILVLALYKCMEAARAADMLWEKQLSWISQLTPLEIGIDPSISKIPVSVFLCHKCLERLCEFLLEW